MLMVMLSVCMGCAGVCHFNGNAQCVHVAVQVFIMLMVMLSVCMCCAGVCHVNGNAQCVHGLCRCLSC